MRWKEQAVGKKVNSMTVKLEGFAGLPVLPYFFFQGFTISSDLPLTLGWGSTILQMKSEQSLWICQTSKRNITLEGGYP